MHPDSAKPGCAREPRRDGTGSCPSPAERSCSSRRSKAQDLRRARQPCPVQVTGGYGHAPLRNHSWEPFLIEPLKLNPVSALETGFLIAKNPVSKAETGLD